jgi:hypothetical protein
MYDIVFGAFGISQTWWNVIPNFCYHVYSFFEFYWLVSETQVFFFNFYFRVLFDILFDFFADLISLLDLGLYDPFNFEFVGVGYDSFFNTRSAVRGQGKGPLIYFNENDSLLGRIWGQLREWHWFGKNSSLNAVEKYERVKLINIEQVDGTKKDVLVSKSDLPYLEILVKNLNANGSLAQQSPEVFLKKLVDKVHKPADWRTVVYDFKRFLWRNCGLKVEVIEEDGVSRYALVNDILEHLPAYRKYVRKMSWFEYIFEGWFFHDIKSWYTLKYFPTEMVTQKYFQPDSYSTALAQYRKISMTYKPLFQFLYDICYIKDVEGKSMVDRVEAMLRSCRTTLDRSFISSFKERLFLDAYMRGRQMNQFFTEKQFKELMHSFLSIAKQYQAGGQYEGSVSVTDESIKLNNVMCSAIIWNFRYNQDWIVNHHILKGRTDFGTLGVMEHHGAFILNWSMNDWLVDDWVRDESRIDARVTFETMNKSLCRSIQPKNFCVLSSSKDCMYGVMKMMDVPRIDNVGYLNKLLDLHPTIQQSSMALYLDGPYHPFMGLDEIRMTGEVVARLLEVFYKAAGNHKLLCQDRVHPILGNILPVVTVDDFILDFGPEKDVDVEDSTSTMYQLAEAIHYAMFMDTLSDKSDDLPLAEVLYHKRPDKMAIWKRNARVLTYNYMVQYYQMAFDARKAYLVHAYTNFMPKLIFSIDMWKGSDFKLHLPYIELSGGRQVKVKYRHGMPLVKLDLYRIHPGMRYKNVDCNDFLKSYILETWSLSKSYLSNDIYNNGTMKCAAKSSYYDLYDMSHWYGKKRLYEISRLERGIYPQSIISSAMNPQLIISSAMNFDDKSWMDNIVYNNVFYRQRVVRLNRTFIWDIKNQVWFMHF